MTSNNKSKFQRKIEMIDKNFKFIALVLAGKYTV